MNTPDVTPTQYGAGGLLLAIALACIAQGVTGTDLAVYLGTAAGVCIPLIIADALLRRGRVPLALAKEYGVELEGDDDADEDTLGLEVDL